ncbi:TPA: hypothetical protein ACFP4Q_000338 [Neisseria weaveri]
MAKSTSSTQEKIKAYLDKRNLNYREENRSTFVLGFSGDDIQKFLLYIFIQENGDFVQFVSVLEVKEYSIKLKDELLKENFNKKLVKWAMPNGNELTNRSVICYVDILIGEDVEISSSQISRALNAIQSSVFDLSKLKIFE